MKLKDIVEICYGKNQKSVEVPFSTIPILGTGGVIGYASKPLYDKESVLIGRKGTIGLPFYIDKPFWTIDTLFYTKINKNKVIPKFLYYLLCTIGLTRYSEGAAVPSLTIKTLNEIDLNIPDMVIQQHIVDTIGSVDNLIERKEKINELLQQKADLLFNSFLSNINDQVPLAQFQKNTICGKTPSTKKNDNWDGSFPFVTTEDLREKPFVIESKRKFNAGAATCIILPGSILTSCIGTVGEVSISAIKCQTNQQINSIIPKKAYTLFLYEALSHSKDKIKTMSMSGTATPNISKSSFLTLPIPNIKNEQLLCFNKLVSPLFKLIFHNMKEILELKIIKSHLLEKYF